MICAFVVTQAFCLLGIVYVRLEAAVGRYAETDAFRSRATQSSVNAGTVLQSGWRHRSARSNWCPLYSGQSVVNARLSTAERTLSVSSWCPLYSAQSVVNAGPARLILQRGRRRWSLCSTATVWVVYPRNGGGEKRKGTKKLCCATVHGAEKKCGSYYCIVHHQVENRLHHGRTAFST